MSEEGAFFLWVAMQMRPENVAVWSAARPSLESAHLANGMRFAGAYTPVFGRLGHVTAMYGMDEPSTYTRAMPALLADGAYVEAGRAIHGLILDEHLDLVAPLSAPTPVVPAALYLRVTMKLALDDVAKWNDARLQMEEAHARHGLLLHGAFSPVYGHLATVTVMYQIADANTFQTATAALREDAEYVKIGTAVHEMILERTVELVRAL